MTTILIWFVTGLGLVGLGLAFFRSERLALRLSVLIGFGAFVLAITFVGLMDSTWFNTSMFAIIVIALMSRQQDARKRRATQEADDAAEPGSGPQDSPPPSDS